MFVVCRAAPKRCKKDCHGFCNRTHKPHIQLRGAHPTAGVPMTSLASTYPSNLARNIAFCLMDHTPTQFCTIPMGDTEQPDETFLFDREHLVVCFKDTSESLFEDRPTPPATFRSRERTLCALGRFVIWVTRHIIKSPQCFPCCPLCMSRIRCDDFRRASTLRCVSRHTLLLMETKRHRMIVLAR